MKKYLSFVLALVLVLTSIAFTASADEIKDLRAYETIAREMETWCYHYSQAAVDLNVLSNFYDHLLTNDANGALVPCVAKEWSSPDGGQTWIFKLNEGVTWVDYQGNYKADCTAQDWVTGLEWVLNYGKNQAANTSMPIEMIKGAGDYYAYTKELGEEEAKKLGTEKFLEMVGLEAPDDYTLIYHCVDKLSYFPSVACYNCLAPLSAKLIEEIGVDGYFGADYTTMWYNGPYTCSEYIYQNEKVLSKNEAYWNKDNVKLFDTVTIKMVESVDVAFQWFSAGDLDYIDLNQANLSTIYNNEGNEFHGNLVEARPTKYSYQMHFCWDKKNEDGSADTNWNTAIANENFRLALYYGLDITDYLARTNFIHPLSCQNYCYTANAVSVNSEGKDYTQMVRDELGLQYDSEKFVRADAAKAAEYKAKAIEELTAAGAKFPIIIYTPYNTGSTYDTQRVQVFEQMLERNLGTDYIDVITEGYADTDYSNSTMRAGNYCIMRSTWMADYLDPLSYTDPFRIVQNRTNFIYMAEGFCKVSDTYVEGSYEGKDGRYYYDIVYDNMVNEANSEYVDLNKRYDLFAECENWLVNEMCMVIPYMRGGTGYMGSSLMPFESQYAAFGASSGRYKYQYIYTDGINTEEYYEAYEAWQEERAAKIAELDAAGKVFGVDY